MEKSEIERLKMKVFFNFLWHMFPRRSEVSSKEFFGEVSSVYYHHVFPKGTYPELAYCVDNILRVTPDEHACLNTDDNYFTEVQTKKEKIEANWDKMVEKSKQFEQKIEETLL